MKKFFVELIKSFFILFILFFTAFVYYIYTPSSAKNLSRQIDSSDPNTLDETRLNLSSELEKYLSIGLPKDPGKTPTLLHLFLANQRKLLDLRIKQAIDHLKNTPAKDDEVQITSLLNMGAIVKTEHHIIAFDVADMPLSTVQKQLAPLVDIFLVTHADSDHYDSVLLQKALENHQKIIFPQGLTLPVQSDNIYELSDGQAIDLDGVKITTYQTDHRLDRNFDQSNAWYLVELDGFKILHTGDGIEFKDRQKKQSLNNMTDIDVFLVNRQIHPYDIRDIHPKLAIPLHLFKFIHSREELTQSTFKSVFDIYRQYNKDLQGINIKFLFPGESTVFQKSTIN